ncbi:FAD-dependent oxidoreductase [Pantoea sp. 18069]|uniref:FAD-dependent oxidoreductase n=1 Tax=Pantoea sp. 18069 TaxID=2681415 RepID=UPI00135A954E|nr:FAD-dependent oxidoreductase [Pantoea sp. 18069]
MIQRRNFLQAAALTAGTLPAISFASGNKSRVGIIGAGIIGASIAAYLVEAGAEVLIFEKGEPASVATRASLAWINPSTVNTHCR